MDAIMRERHSNSRIVLRTPGSRHLLTRVIGCAHQWEPSAMLDDDEDLDDMSTERLRALQQEVLLRIEEIGTHDGAVDPDVAEEIAKLDDLLQEIEDRLNGPDSETR
jgi:hypothetical protein